jgi:clan AA aspartic protease (TIGR02281 family)
VDFDDALCPQCDERFQPPRRRWSFIALAGSVVLIAAGAAWWLSRPSDPRTGPEDTRPAPVVEPVRRGPPSTTQRPVTQPPPTATRAPSHFLPIHDRAGRPAGFLLVLKQVRAERQHYCIPAGLLPTDGPLFDERAEPVEFEVITWDRVSGIVLLVGPCVGESEAAAIEAIELAAVGTFDKTTALRAITPAGHELAGFHAEPQTVPLITDRIASAGSVLIDAAGRAVAMMGTRQFLPLHLVAPWLREWRGEALAAVQRRIRATDPESVLEDAQRLLDNDTTDLDRVAAAILLLQQSQHLVHDVPQAQAFDRVTRLAHHQRIRLASVTDGVQALQYALGSFVQFGDHHGIHSDTVLLQLLHGDPLQALQLFESLQMASAAHAGKIADQVAREVVKEIRTRLRAGQTAKAVELAAFAVRVLPQRAPLHMAYAEALLRAGDRVGAAAQGQEAARLDGSYLAQAAKLQATDQTRRNPRQVVIPFDPAHKQINTTGTIRGHQLGLVVDTGASYTTIPTALADTLGLRSPTNKRHKVETANGTVVAEQVVLPDLTIAGAIHLKGVRAMVLDLPGTLVANGLLGLDVLQQLDLRIDSEKSELILRQPRRRRGR